jgi:hypothetical protein
MTKIFEETIYRNPQKNSLSGVRRADTVYPHELHVRCRQRPPFPRLAPHPPHLAPYLTTTIPALANSMDCAGRARAATALFA